MKAAKTIASKVNAAAVLALTMFMSQSAFAQGLARARGFLGGFRDEVLLFVPIIAVIGLILLGIGYANKFVEKETFARWCGGILIAGSAAEIVALFWG